MESYIGPYLLPLTVCPLITEHCVSPKQQTVPKHRMSLNYRQVIVDNKTQSSWCYKTQSGCSDTSACPGASTGNVCYPSDKLGIKLLTRAKGASDRLPTISTIPGPITCGLHLIRRRPFLSPIDCYI